MTNTCAICHQPAPMSATVANRIVRRGPDLQPVTMTVAACGPAQVERELATV